MFNSLYFVAAFLITLAAHRYWTRRAEHAAATTLPEKNHQATTSNRSTHTKGDKAPGIKQQTQITADGFFRPDPMPPVDLEHAMTRNYLYGRGLRYPMHMGMAHSSLHPNHWLEIDYEYEYYLKRTKDLMDRFGEALRILLV